MTDEEIRELAAKIIVTNLDRSAEFIDVKEAVYEIDTDVDEDVLARVANEIREMLDFLSEYSEEAEES